MVVFFTQRIEAHRYFAQAGCFCLELGNCDLDFVWNLRIVIWCFPV